jgi:hypothetical protein
MGEWFQGVVDRWYGAVADRPAPEGTTWVAIGLGLALVLANGLLLWRSASWGARLLEVAATRLRRRLWVTRRQRGYVGLAEIRAHSLQVQRETGAVLLTEPVIGEAVRAAADELPAPDPVLEMLVTQVRDPGGARPMSIANTNRLLAYVLSAFSVSLLALVTQLTTSSPVPEDAPAVARALALAGVWGPLLVQAWLALLGLRAMAFWRGRYRALADAEVTRVPCPPPRPLSRVLDFFAWIMSEGDYFKVHVWWAPLWETVCFGMLPLVCGIYGGLWATDQIFKAAGSGPELIRPVVFYETIFLLLIFVFGWGTCCFALFHEYRWLEAWRLRSRFETLRRDCLLFKMAVLTTNPVNDFISVGRRLWVITGHDPYRDPLRLL